MRTLERLFKKKKKLVVGLMSGTSADGIDAALIEVVGSGTHTRIRQLAFETYPYPKGYKQFLFENSSAVTARLDDIARLNMFVAMIFSDAARRIVHNVGKRMSDVDLIGSHGQTIHHLPTLKRVFGKNVRASLQIGSPSVITKLTGVVTVGDFRVGDIAVGGTGAPLVPYFDYLIFRSSSITRALLNIGGIANLTILPKGCAVKDVLAFDTGPGNMLVDGLMQTLYKKPFDAEGKTASSGTIIPELLRWMMKHSYFQNQPPKSTGREMFGEIFFKQILARCKRQRREDIITTATEFTALSIYQSYLQFVNRRTKLDELLVSGGGVHNRYLMEALGRYFTGVNVAPLDSVGFLSDAKEAICFAVLANETISGNSANVPGATGAQKRTILGTICLP